MMWGRIGVAGVPSRCVRVEEGRKLSSRVTSFSGPAPRDSPKNIPVVPTSTKAIVSSSNLIHGLYLGKSMESGVMTLKFYATSRSSFTRMQIWKTWKPMLREY
jgi:hypothetical protein